MTLLMTPMSVDIATTFRTMMHREISVESNVSYFDIVTAMETSDAEPESTDAILCRLSDEKAMQLLPVLIIFGIFLIIGVFGNSLVIFIYHTKFKASLAHSAIITLAVFDLVSSLVGIPGEIVDLRFSFNYNYDVICRIARVCETFPNIASGIMLTAVAWNRYRLICSPLASYDQYSRRSIKKYVITACTLSLLFTWPAALVYGTMTFDTEIKNVTGKECSTSDSFKDTPIPLVYNIILAIFFLTAFVAMIVMYSVIGRQVCRQGAFRKSLQTLSGIHHSTDDSHRDTGKNVSFKEEQELSRCDTPLERVSQTNIAVHRNVVDPLRQSSTQRSLQIEQPCASVDHHTPSEIKSNSPQNPASHVKPPKGSYSSLNDSRSRRTTFMLCLISFVFVLSYLPHLITKLVSIVNKDFAKDADIVSLIFYNLFARSHFISNISNLFIYGMCSFRFRRECRKAFVRALTCERRVI